MGQGAARRQDDARPRRRGGALASPTAAAEITVLVGRELSADLLAPLRRAGVDARLTDLGGAAVATSGATWPSSAVSEDLELDDIDGKPIAHLVVAVSDATLEEHLRELALTTLGLVVAAIAAAALLGAFVSRRTTRDLEALTRRRPGGGRAATSSTRSASAHPTRSARSPPPSTP